MDNIMHDLTSFQRDLLYVVGGLDDPNGMKVKRRLEQYYDEEVQSGYLYPTLDRLVGMTLIHKEPADDRMNIYTLTDRGIRELEARHKWENQYVSSPPNLLPSD